MQRKIHGAGRAAVILAAAIQAGLVGGLAAQQPAPTPPSPESVLKAAPLPKGEQAAPGVDAPSAVPLPDDLMRPKRPAAGATLAPQKIAEWLKPIDQLNTTITPPEGRLPPDVAAQLAVGAPRDVVAERRGWGSTAFNWEPPELYFQPPYWDRVPLERYGQTTTKPATEFWLSAAHFFGTFVTMPYKMGIDGTHDRIYTLGYYRPGSAAPPVKQTLPYEPNAAANEFGTWAGLLLVLP